MWQCVCGRGVGDTKHWCVGVGVGVGAGVACAQVTPEVVVPSQAAAPLTVVSRYAPLG